MEKDKVLEKLSKMSVEQLDEMRCEKLLLLKDALKKQHLYKDNLLVSRREKEQTLLQSGLKESQISRELQRDEELFKLKRLVGESTYLVKKIKLQIEILGSYFWANKI